MDTPIVSNPMASAETPSQLPPGSQSQCSSSGSSQREFAGSMKSRCAASVSKEDLLARIRRRTLLRERYAANIAARKESTSTPKVKEEEIESPSSAKPSLRNSGEDENSQISLYKIRPPFSTSSCTSSGSSDDDSEMDVDEIVIVQEVSNKNKKSTPSPKIGREKEDVRKKSESPEMKTQYCQTEDYNCLDCKNLKATVDKLNQQLKKMESITTDLVEGFKMFQSGMTCLVPSTPSHVLEYVNETLDMCSESDGDDVDKAISTEGDSSLIDNFEKQKPPENGQISKSKVSKHLNPLRTPLRYRKRHPLSTPKTPRISSMTKFIVSREFAPSPSVSKVSPLKITETVVPAPSVTLFQQSATTCPLTNTEKTLPVSSESTTVPPLTSSTGNQPMSSESTNVKTAPEIRISSVAPRFTMPANHKPNGPSFTRRFFNATITSKIRTAGSTTNVNKPPTIPDSTTLLVPTVVQIPGDISEPLNPNTQSYINKNILEQPLPSKPKKSCKNKNRKRKVKVPAYQQQPLTRNFICYSCGEPFTSKPLLFTHQNEHHQILLLE